MRLDLRGHGKSDVGGGPFSIKTSRVMADVLDRLRIKRTHFVGSSLAPWRNGAHSITGIAFPVTFVALQGAYRTHRCARDLVRGASNATPKTTFADQTGRCWRLLGDIDEATKPTFALLRQILGDNVVRSGA